MYTTAVGIKRTSKQKSPTELGKLISDKRKLDGLSLRQAARDIGIEHSGLSELEQTDRRPDFETIVKLSAGLKIPLDELARAAARDLGFQPATTEEAFKVLLSSLTARAEMYPDLRKVLDHLTTTDPTQYRAFLVMFQTFQSLRQDDAQADERQT